MSAETASTSGEQTRQERRRETEEQIKEKRRARNAEHYGQGRHDGNEAGAEPYKPPPGSSVMRMFLALATALLAVNLFTGGPLFAVWVGSQVQAGTSGVGMGALGVIVGLLIVLTLIDVWLLNRIAHTYARLTGQPKKRRTVSYLQSRAADAVSKDSQERTQLNGFEKVLIATITVAVVGFEVWFFLFSGSSIGGSSGR